MLVDDKSSLVELLRHLSRHSGQKSKRKFHFYFKFLENVKFLEKLTKGLVYKRLPTKVNQKVAVYKHVIGLKRQPGGDVSCKITTRTSIIYRIPHTNSNDCKHKVQAL